MVNCLLNTVVSEETNFVVVGFKKDSAFNKDVRFLCEGVKTDLLENVDCGSLFN